ncbi:hypothetical protein RFI_16191 [Reticulomyxa filosa]|uniref:Clathrin/coatomer adaptor adaptin-like N-terminal domain-containing protein n=1 Tax=Reticulomyxa filosa TaxID=46433 RepID=X6N408_RETFI|nr:hypothetical protein RFI_16191 [Reticulomyxa filosa]|eukprot:ETO21015.1 hypothetical protein RFI_16191 [Reticulomyxa filosa]
MPAPWIQIRLLQIVGHLGQADKTASEGMYEVLHEVMRRADIGINVGYAIIYECVRTVTTIYPNAQLLAEAAKCTSRFITSDNHNLKYLGINALASIVQVNPNAAKEHQMVVIDCLEDKDETLRRKTLDLLFRMTNDHNVKVICMKFLVSLKDSVDVYLRQELIEKITSLAESYAPDPIWYIETMTEVFELGGELVQEQIAHNFIKHVALGIEQAGDDGEEDELDRDAKNSDVAQYVADFFLEQLDHIRIPNILLKVVAWVLGEYGHLATGHLDEETKPGQEQKEDAQEKVVYSPLSPVTVITKLWDVVEKQGENYETRMWTMAATCKLIKHLNPIPSEIVEIIQKYSQAINSDLQQLAGELLEMVKERQMLASVFASSNITDDIVVDDKLSFLDTYVSEYVQSHSGREYRPATAEKKLGQVMPTKASKEKLRLVHREATDTTMIEEVAIGPTSHPVAKTFTLPTQPSEPDVDRSLFSSSGLARTAAAGRWSEKGYENGQSAQEDEYPETTTATAANITATNSSSATTITKAEPTQTKTAEPSTNVIEKAPPAKKVVESAQNAQIMAIFGEGDSAIANDPDAFRKDRRKKRFASSTKIVPTRSQTTISSTAVPKKVEQEKKQDTDNLFDFVSEQPQPQSQPPSKQAPKPKTATAPTSTASKPTTTSTSNTGGGLLDDLFGYITCIYRYLLFVCVCHWLNEFFFFFLQIIICNVIIFLMVNIHTTQLNSNPPKQALQ